MDEKLKEQVAKLVGGLAHEIKTPLSTIGMNLQLITEDLEQGGSAMTAREQRLYRKVQLLQKEVFRLERSLNGFIRFIGPRSMEKKPGSINLLVEEILDFVQPEADAHSVAVRRRLDYRIPLFHFDFEPIRQAALNVIKNALEEMRDGGELFVETAQEHGSVTLSVTDTGRSISGEELDRIFVPYYSTKPEGTGLGLAVAKQAVEDHGGTICYSDASPKGACFTIRLPLGAVPPRKPSARQPRS